MLNLDNYDNAASFGNTSFPIRHQSGPCVAAYSYKQSGDLLADTMKH